MTTTGTEPVAALDRPIEELLAVLGPVLAGDYRRAVAGVRVEVLGHTDEDATEVVVASADTDMVLEVANRSINLGRIGAEPLRIAFTTEVLTHIDRMRAIIKASGVEVRGWPLLSGTTVAEPGREMHIVL